MLHLNEAVKLRQEKNLAPICAARDDEIMGDDELLHYFMEQTNDRFNKVEDRFDKIEGKIDELLSFKWQIVGGSVVLSVLATSILDFMK